jgi:thiol-disulfide isomerase/thioredoxin
MPKFLVIALLCSCLTVQSLRAQLLASNNFTPAARLKDCYGKSYALKPAGKNIVYLFLSPECPLCRNYGPILAALQQKYKDVQFYGVVSGKTFTSHDVAVYVKDYGINFPVLMDGNKHVADALKATVTPEALLVGSNGKEYYRGLIDDWVTGLGAKRAKASKLYLDQAIGNLLQGSEMVSATTPIGCYISNY